MQESPPIIYLDNNATTRPLPEVAEAIDQANRELWANPSSVHRFGQLVRQRMELARQSVASLIGAKPRDLLFTSGGTEANNLAIRGLLDRPATSEVQPVLLTTKVEHAAVREPAEAMEKRGGHVVWLSLDDQGRVEIDALNDALTKLRPDAPALVSVQWANNETGVIQPMAEIAAAVDACRDQAREQRRRPNVFLHVDATQAVGKLPVDVGALSLDMMTLAAHKLHGPKGVGVLYRRSGVRLTPQQTGGPQEREMRGGTENVSGIIGFGIAAKHALPFVQDESAVSALRGQRDRLESLVREALPEVVVNSGKADRLWNTSNMGFTGLEAEAILLGLSERGVCASAGAACSSGSLDPSPVLRAMGVSEPVAHGSVRLSLSRFTTSDEVDRAAEVLIAVVKRLGRVLPTG